MYCTVAPASTLRKGPKPFGMNHRFASSGSWCSDPRDQPGLVSLVNIAGGRVPAMVSGTVVQLPPLSALYRVGQPIHPSTTVLLSANTWHMPTGPLAVNPPLNIVVVMSVHVEPVALDR